MTVSCLRGPAPIGLSYQKPSFMVQNLWLRRFNIVPTFNIRPAGINLQIQSNCLTRKQSNVIFSPARKRKLMMRQLNPVAQFFFKLQSTFSTLVHCQYWLNGTERQMWTFAKIRRRFTSGTGGGETNTRLQRRGRNFWPTAILQFLVYAR